jgi:hypothetical protein
MSADDPKRTCIVSDLFDPAISGPIGRSRSCQDFLDFRHIGRKLPLQVFLQKMKPVISPEDLAVNYKARNAKHSGRDGAFRLETKRRTLAPRQADAKQATDTG